MKIKTRKLFAILAITMLLLTLLPVTAIASSDAVLGATAIEVDVTDLTVGAAATFTLTFRRMDGTAVVTPPVNFWIRSSRGAETFATPAAALVAGTFTPAVGTPISAAGTEMSAATLATGGRVSFGVSSVFSGPTTITFWDTTPAAIGASQIGAPVTLNFAARAVGGANSLFSATPTSAAITAPVVLSATVRDTVTAPVMGATVTFQRSLAGGAWSTIDTRTSNAVGAATLTVTETVTGAYSYRAMVGATVLQVPVAVTFTGAAAAALTAVTEAGNMARNAAQNVDFRVTDLLGNNVAGQVVSFRITRPAGSAVATTGTATSDADGRARFVLTPDVLGAYTITASFGGFSSAVTMTAVDLGAVTRMEFAMPRGRTGLRSMVAGVGMTAVATIDFADSIRLFDAAGVSRAPAVGEVTLATSNPALVTTSALVISLASATVARGLVTITAMHTPTGQVATLRVPIVGFPTGILETTTVAALNASVALQIVDVDVNPTFTAPAPAAALPFTVNVPAGLRVVSSTPFAAGTGRGGLELAADAPGEYTVVVVTTHRAPYTPISRTFTVEFAAPAVPAPGAQSVTMFIGARGFVADGVGKTMDAAPFIENERTFVPVRFLAESFGATADWVPKDAPVRTVTLTREGLTITINIGSPEISIVENGVTRTVTADVAAAIRNGRTVLPFRAIAEAFGAEVDYGPKDAPVEWVSFKQ